MKSNIHFSFLYYLSLFSLVYCYNFNDFKSYPVPSFSSIPSSSSSSFDYPHQPSHFNDNDLNFIETQLLINNNAGHGSSYRYHNRGNAHNDYTSHVNCNNNYPRSVTQNKLINDYFDDGSGSTNSQGSFSWGNPQHPSAAPYYPHKDNFIFPCVKLEKALQKVKLNFNLAVDHKWNYLTKMEATIFKQDLTVLCNVIRSNFHRASETLRKSGQLSCESHENYHRTVGSALEALISSSQDTRWYRRLRKFAGADAFHLIVNEIASTTDN